MVGSSVVEGSRSLLGDEGTFFVTVSDALEVATLGATPPDVHRVAGALSLIAPTPGDWVTRTGPPQSRKDACGRVSAMQELRRHPGKARRDGRLTRAPSLPAG